MSALLEVIAPGMLTTVQDLGRVGHQREGVPVSGAMDPWALETGNALLGNPRGAAALEIALAGPTLRMRAEALLCFTGADFGAEVAGRRIAPWTVVQARAGDTIRCAGPARGAWAYLCFAGGIDVPPVLGSRSTYLRGGFGGFEGRTLRAGDVLHAGPARSPMGAGTALDPAAVHAPVAAFVARAVPGPEEHLFGREAVESFYGSAFAVSPQSDRMGYRLDGPRIRPAAPSGDLASEGTAWGLVQVPPDGQPIVLMADRQTTGGYARIATVASVDVPRIAQLLPGGIVRFRRVTVDEAREAALAERRLLP
jgi:antagonist of KipI